MIMAKVMYMTEDYTGLASGIEYAKKGDQVDVVDSTTDMILVEKSGVRFHVNRVRLTTEVPVTKEESKDPEEQQTETASLKPALAKKKVVKVPVADQNQTTLF